MDSRQDIRAYLAKHNLRRVLQDKLEDIVVRQPAQPLLYLQESFAEDARLKSKLPRLDGEGGQQGVHTGEGGPGAASLDEMVWVKARVAVQGRGGWRGEVEFDRRANAKMCRGSMGAAMVREWGEALGSEVTQALMERGGGAGGDGLDGKGGAAAGGEDDGELHERLAKEVGGSHPQVSLDAKVAQLERELAKARAAATREKSSMMATLPPTVRARELYEGFKDKLCRGMNLAEMGAIMKIMGLAFDEESVSAVFEQLDTNKNGLISLDEWLAFADGVPFLAEEETDGDMLHSVPSPQADSEDSQKPTQSAATFVDTSSFDAGVEKLIGRADPNTRAAIKAEHCLSEDSMDTFQTDSTGVLTTSFKEYWIAAGPGGNDEDAPDPLPVPDPGEAKRREVEPLHELLATDVCRNASLMWEEVLALRLWSSPMYQKYNALLREYKKYDAILKGNKYTTTIHLILSGILKLSKVQQIPRDRIVYRGLGGRSLPEKFCLRDSNRCRGGVEAGFLSTTTSKEVALRYSGNSQSPPHQQRDNIIFEIELGKMSMGADISEISQYPGQNDFVFPPLTHLEIIGKPRQEDAILDGQQMSVLVVRLRATTNQKSLTLDQLLLERKTMLLDLGRKLVKQCNQLIGSGVQHGKSVTGVLELTGDDSNISMSELMDRHASKVQELESHIEAEIEAVQETAFNDLVIYQETTTRLFQKFVSTCRGMAEGFASEVDLEKLKENASALRVMIVSCTASIKCMDAMPEEYEVIQKLKDMKHSFIKLLEFHSENTGLEKGSKGWRSVCSLLASAKLDYGRLLYGKLSEHSNAKNMFREVIAYRTETEGEESFGALEAQEYLGLIMYENRGLTEAMETFKKIFEVRKKNSHHDTEKDKKWTLGVAEALRNMGRVHFRLSDSDGAISLYNESLKIRNEAQTPELAERDMVIAKLREHLGSAFASKRDSSTALEHFHTSLKITKQATAHSREKSLTAFFMPLVLALNGLMWRDPDVPDSAGLDSPQVLGPVNLSVADIYNLMGKPHLDQGQQEEALKLYRESIDIKTRILGENHSSLARSWNNLASVHMKLNEYEDAIKCLEKGLRINTIVYGATSPHCISVIESMIKTRNTQKGQEREMLKLTTRLLEVLRQLFNPPPLINDQDKAETDRSQVWWTMERFKTGCDLCKHLVGAGDLHMKLSESTCTDEEKESAFRGQMIHYHEASARIDDLKAGKYILAAQCQGMEPSQSAAQEKRLGGMMESVQRMTDDIAAWKKENPGSLTVLTAQETQTLKVAAGSGRAMNDNDTLKWDEVWSLKTGRPQQAALGLSSLMCVDKGDASKDFHDLVLKGVQGIEEEVERFVEQNKDDENVREVGELLHYILKEGTSEKEYVNGIRDEGRPHGTRLDYFTGHQTAIDAGLEPEHVVALRLYTTAAYKYMNQPLRDEERKIERKPCSLPVCTHFADEGIKRLRSMHSPDVARQKLEALSVNQIESSAQQGWTLWRGMRSVKATEDFRREGGTEMAFMSTTQDLEVAVKYAVQGTSLLFKVKATNFMVLGADVQWLSAFPAEREYLYPPLTYLHPTGRTEEIEVDRGGLTTHFTVIEVEPVMG